MNAFTDKVTNYAHVMPSSEQHYVHFMYNVEQTFCSLHTYVAGESRTFKVELVCSKEFH